MFGAIIRALLYICGLALCYYLVLWVLAEIGIMLPHMVVVILGVMLALIAILVLYQLFNPWFANWQWFPQRRPPPPPRP
jgi:hypothetical protein